MLSLAEKFILLALDKNKGKFLIDSLSLNYGIAGAILLELSEKNKIEINNKKLVLVDKKNTNSLILDETIKIINNSKRNRKIKYWINKLGNKVSRLKKNILNDLYKNGVLTIKKKSYLWGLIKVYRYPIFKRDIVNNLQNKLNGVVLENKKSETDDILLLSLIYSCKLTRVIFQNKREYKIANKRIKEIVKNIEIGDAVGQALKEIQAAVLVATTSAFIGASSASN